MSKPNLQISTYATYKQQVEKISSYFRKTNITLLNLKTNIINKNANANVLLKEMKDEETDDYLEFLEWKKKKKHLEEEM